MNNAILLPNDGMGCDELEVYLLVLIGTIMRGTNLWRVRDITNMGRSTLKCVRCF